jgi:Ca2+-binding RTX toxin-like protein
MFTETLETRRMFAVTTWTSGSALIVDGDAADNQIFVYKNPTTDRLNVYDTGVPGWSLVGSWPSRSVTEIEVRGYAGNDRLEIDNNAYRNITQSATLLGGNGNDTLRGGLASNHLSGGAGYDTVDYTGRTENLSLSIDGVANDGAAGEHDYIRSDVEHVLGGEGDDTITGSNFADVLEGNGGNDRIFARGGADWVLGGDGNDLLYGDGGSDIVAGGNGDDLVSGHRTHLDRWDDATDHLIGGAGRDVLIGFGGRDFYTSNDDGGEVDDLLVTFGGGGVADRVFAGPGDHVL